MVHLSILAVRLRLRNRVTHGGVEPAELLAGDVDEVEQRRLDGRHERRHLQSDLHHLRLPRHKQRVREHQQEPALFVISRQRGGTGRGGW